MNQTFLKYAAVIGLGLVLWVALLRFIDPFQIPPSLTNGSDRKTADFAWTLKDFQGKPVDFAQYKGKVVFLNIWATWCPPCVSEMPSITMLATHPKLQGKGIEFLCVSVDDDPEAPRAFWQQRKLKGTPLWFGGEAIPTVYATDGIPATFIIAPDGRIAVAEVGSARWDDPKVVELLEQLAQEVKASS